MYFESPDMYFESPDMYFESPDMYFESPDMYFESPDMPFESPDMYFESPALFSRHVFDSPDMPFESPALISRGFFLIILKKLIFGKSQQTTTKHEKLPSMQRVISDWVDIHAALSLYWVQSCTGSIHGSRSQQLVNHLLSLSEYSFFAKDLS